jgi:hypothetical protein
MAPFLPALARLDGVTRENRSLQVPDSGVNGYSTPRKDVRVDLIKSTAIRFSQSQVDCLLLPKADV